MKSLKELVIEAVSRPDVSLPVLDPVARELQVLMGDPEAPSDAVEAVVGRDPALALQVLRFANSSMYAGLSSLATLRQALMRLGTHQVMRLSFAAAQSGLYKASDPRCKRRMSGLWDAAWASSRGCAWMMEAIGRKDLADEAFMAGLLHDAGKLVILRSLDELISAKEGPLAISGDLIDDVVETLHGQCGRDLMAHWNLPECYQRIAAEHHAPAREDDVLMLCVRLMDQQCQRIGIGCHPDPEQIPAASEEAGMLGLGEVQLADLEITLEDELPAAA